MKKTSLTPSQYLAANIWPPLIATLIMAILFSLPSMANKNKHVALDADRIAHLSSLTTIVGDDSTLKDQLEGKVSVVAFFASWCPPCRTEFGVLNEITEKLGDKAPTIVAINVFEEFDDNDKERMEKFLKDTAPTFHVVEGTEESLALFGDVFRIPTLYVFDQGGKMAFDFIHAPGAKKMSVGSDELLEALTPLLSAEPA